MSHRGRSTIRYRKLAELEVPPEDLMKPANKSGYPFSDPPFSDLSTTSMEEGSPDTSGEYSGIKAVLGYMYQYFQSGIFLQLAIWYAMYTIYVAAVTMIIYFTGLHDFILGSDFQIVVSFEFVQWTIVFIHNKTLAIALDRYESGPRKLWGLLSAMRTFGAMYFSYIEKQSIKDPRGSKIKYVLEPLDFMREVAYRVLRTFDSRRDFSVLWHCESVQKSIDTWGFEPQEHVRFAHASMTRVMMTLGDAMSEDRFSTVEIQQLNGQTQKIMEHIDSVFEDKNVRSPEIYENFFTLAMIIYLFSFFIFTTYRNAQQFTPLVAPVIVAIVFGPYVIGKVLRGPFAQDTMYRGNEFYEWLRLTLTELMLYIDAMDVMWNNAATGVAASASDVYDNLLSKVNKQRQTIRMRAFMLQKGMSSRPRESV